MKYKVGDEVRIKSLDWYNKNKDKNGSVFANGLPFCEEMSEYCGTYVTIADVYEYYYTIRGVPYCWTDDMIECLTDAHCKLGIVPTEKGDELIPHKDYETKQEGEKFYLVKKGKYPKTYEECAEIIAELTGSDCNPKGCMGYMSVQLTALQKLLICRDAYWVVAGKEMGFEKPWEPDWNIRGYYAIARSYGNVVKTSNYNCDLTFVFPTEEMRDAFKENFDPDIEICKELL